MEYHNIKPEEYTKQAVKAKLKQDHMKALKNKPLHRYFFEKIEADDEVDQEASNQWFHSGMSSHIEGYINTVQEQEVATKATEKRKNKDHTINSKCWLCETLKETVLHVLGACPSLSTNLYNISARHDNVGQIIVEEVLKQENKDHQQRRCPESVIETPTKEIWWNIPVTTTNKVEYKPPRCTGVGKAK